MVRPPCSDKVGIKKGPWTPEEDVILLTFINENGPGNWCAVPASTGLLRSSKSCRLRWSNYLKPGIKRGNFTPDEEGIIVHLQALLGNKWAAIATHLPQRTDNDIKNFWNTHLKKKLKKLQSAAMVPQQMAAHDTKTRGRNVAEDTSLHASSAENISRIMQDCISLSSPSLQGNTRATSSDHSVNYDEFYRDFGKIPTASCDASSDELQRSMLQQCGITGDDHELEKTLSLDRGSIDNVASSCDSSRFVDQEKVHSMHDDEEGMINVNPQFSFLEDWLLEENEEGGDKILPTF